jgi:hypothetical protein
MRDPLSLWQSASCLFFLYAIVVALFRGPAARRRFALVMSATGLAATASSMAIPRITWLHDWLLPPSLLEQRSALHGANEPSRGDADGG